MKKLILGLMLVSGMTFAFEDALIKNSSGSDLVYSIKVDGEWGSWSFLDDGDEIDIPIDGEASLFRYYEGEDIRYFELEDGATYDFRQRKNGKGIALFEAEPAEIPEPPRREARTEEPKAPSVEFPVPKDPKIVSKPPVTKHTPRRSQPIISQAAPIHLGPVIHHDPFYCPPGQIIYERPVFQPFGGFFRRVFR